MLPRRCNTKCSVPLLLDDAVRQGSHVFTVSSSEDRSLLVITLVMGDNLPQVDVLANECH